MDTRWRAPWFDPYRAILEDAGGAALRGDWADCVARLDARANAIGLRNDNGRPLRFVAADAAGDTPYESHIWATGGVPTRTGPEGGWHDFFNASAWLTFPRTKARLNRLQAEALAAGCTGARRGGLRDAATLFDENAALLLTRDRSLVEALRRFDWHGVFLEKRARFAAEVRVLAFGHALVDKLRAPWKSVCAHAWVLLADPDADADSVASASLGPDTLRSGGFTPLPVLGIPGWWPDNANPAFYDDPRVFRSGRSRASMSD